MHFAVRFASTIHRTGHDNFLTGNVVSPEAEDWPLPLSPE